MAIITADSWDEFADGTYFVEDGAYTLWHSARVYKPFRLDPVNSRFGANFPYQASTSGNGGTWVGVRELPSGRKYVCTGLTTNQSTSTFFVIENQFFYSLITTYKLPKEGKTLIGWWIYTTPGSNIPTGFSKGLTSLQSINSGGQANTLTSSMPAVPEGQETFVEVHIDFDNNHIDAFHNGVQVLDINQTDITDYRVVPGAQYNGGTVSSSNALFTGLGPIIVAHNNPGDPNPTTSLAGMEVLPIRVETVVEQNGWASSDETKTIPEVLDPSVDTELSNADSPFVIASPDELISKYRFNVPNIAGSMHYVNLGVRAGSAPGRTDKVQTLLSFKNSISDFVEFDTAENMETHVIASANKTPSGGNWTINDLNTLELWMNAKSSTSDNPYPFDVGPGPKELIAGDIFSGYFGEVPGTEFITPGDLQQAVSISGGTSSSQPDNLAWFKFMYNGRILFTPRLNIRFGLNYKNLYEQGLVYGVDGPGVIVPAGSAPTNQLRTISVLGYTFKVRLMTSSDDNTVFDGIEKDIVAPFSRFGEVGNLLLRLSSYHTEDPWEDYILSYIGFPTSGVRVFPAQECTEDGIVGAYLQNVSDTIRVRSTYETGSSLGTSVGWRPVLELIPD